MEKVSNNLKPNCRAETPGNLREKLKERNTTVNVIFRKCGAELKPECRGNPGLERMPSEMPK